MSENQENISESASAPEAAAASLGEPCEPVAESRNRDFRQNDEDRSSSSGPSGSSPQVSSLRPAHVEVYGPRRVGRDCRR